MNEATREEKIGLLTQRRHHYTMQAQTVRDDLEILTQTATDRDDYQETHDKLTGQIEQLEKADKVAEGMLMVLENEEE